MQSSGRKWDDFAGGRFWEEARREKRKKATARKEEREETGEAEWKKEVTFFPRLAGTFEVGQDGERRGPFYEGTEARKKRGEDRVNEMASKDELNCGRKETRSGLALLIDSSQTQSFQHRGGVPKPEFLSSAL